VSGPGGTWEIGEAKILRSSSDAEVLGEISSPMPGSVVAILHSGDGHVEAGTPVLVVEAMKMEHTMTAPRAGELSIHVSVGDKVTGGQRLATIIDHSEGNPT
jgi:acetyl-CoA/propionyl-CoA carboxylase biotin carboxyl carrier protein